MRSVCVCTLFFALVSFCVLPVQSYSACIVSPSDLVAWWRAENNALDTQGTNDGTPQNGTTYAAGKVGQAFSFDGTDDYIAVPNGIIEKTARDFTIDAWVYLLSTHTDGRKILYGGSTGGEYSFQVTSNGDLKFDIKLTDDSWYAVTTAATLSTWMHVAAVRRGGTAIELWVNGEKKTENTTVPDLDLIDVNNGMNNSRIGAYNEFTTEHKGFWHGYIDELSVYDRALLSAEISSLHSAGSSGKCLQVQSPKSFNWTMFLPALMYGVQP